MKNQYYVGQKIVWHCKDFETDCYIKAVIKEIATDHCVAMSERNKHPNLNDLKIWIDDDIEEMIYLE